MFNYENGRCARMDDNYMPALTGGGG